MKSLQYLVIQESQQSMNIFESDQEIFNPSRNNISRDHEPPSQIENIAANSFELSDDHKANLSKRLPIGFSLMPKKDFQRLDRFKNQSQHIEIQFVPRQRQKKEIIDPIAAAIEQTWAANYKNNMEEKKIRSVNQSYEGRSRQMERIKNIIQRFRKYAKYPILSTHLNKVGLMQALNQIQSENKRSLLNIDTFRQRMNLVLETTKSTTYETTIIAVIDEMMEQLQCYCEQARKGQFQKNIESIQKSIDKITRYITEPTDNTKSTGIYYAKKKRKSQRLEPYSDSQIIYICDLINQLPPPYLIGLWQIVEEKPFCEIPQNSYQIRMRQLPNPKKLRQIELYVKGKHSLLWKSRQKKRQKLLEIRRNRDGGDIEQQESYNNHRVKIQDQLIGLVKINEESVLNQVMRPIPEQDNFDDDLDDLLDRRELSPMIASIGGVKQEEDGYMPKGLETPRFKQMVDMKVKEQELDIPIYHQQQQQQEEQEDNSSDSSMITDEDQSDF